MKRLLYASCALALLGGSMNANAQAWSQNFNGGIPANWVMIKADANVPASNFNAAIISGLTNKAWMAWAKAAGDSAALTVSWFNPVGKADRWLITPSFTVNDPNMVISWEDYCPDATYTDSIQVLVATNAGTTAADFTTTLYNQKASADGYTKKGVNLGNVYNGQTVRIAFRDNSTDQYLLFLDNVAAEVAPAKDGGVDSISFPKLAAANTQLKVFVKNFGAQNITSVKMEYSIDGGAAVSETFNGLNIYPFAKQLLTFTAPINAAQGPHTITVTLTEVNGAADPVASNNTKSTNFTIAGNPVTRNGLIEEFTSSTCAPCASFNTTFDPLILQNNANLQESRFSIIKYQMNWPSPFNDVSYNAHGASRRGYYGVSGIPDHYTNGGPGGSGNQAEIDNSKTKTSFLTMDGSYVVTNDSLIATVTMTPNFTLTNAGFKLHVAAIEDHYTNSGATTSQKEYYHVMRTMFPDGNGTTVNDFTSGTPQTFTFRMAYTQGNVTQNSFNFWGHPIGGSMVAFVQDNSNKDVLQAISVRASWPASVGNVNNGIANVSLFPNPATDHSTLAFSLAKASSVSVSIVDNLGRVVYNIPSKNFAAGTQVIAIPTENIATGVYNVIIKTDNENITERLNVIK